MFKQQKRGSGNNKYNSFFSLCNPKNKRTKRNNLRPNMLFRCGSKDHWIADFTKPVNWKREFTETWKIKNR